MDLEDRNGVFKPLYDFHEEWDCRAQVQVPSLLAHIQEVPEHLFCRLCRRIALGPLQVKSSSACCNKTRESGFICSRCIYPSHLTPGGPSSFMCRHCSTAIPLVMSNFEFNVEAAQELETAEQMCVEKHGHVYTCQLPIAWLTNPRTLTARNWWK